MSLIHSFLCIVITSLVPLCFSQEEFRCKAVAGCEIARCDPSPLSWAHLDRNEFPINCVSYDVSKGKRYEEKVKALESKVEDLTEELERLWDMNDDIKDMKKQITALEQRKMGVATVTATSALTTTPLSTTADGWTVFQRRQDGSVDFNRTWDEYVNGFGNEDGEFWMGLEKLHIMTSSGNYELRIDLRDWNENSVYAEYSEFSVGSASSNYRLMVSGYSGTAGDSLINAERSSFIHNGMAFSAKDSDNDLRRRHSCAKDLSGGWWFNACYSSNLNGVYYHEGEHTEKHSDGIVWYPWKYDFFYSMKFVEMKLRPAQ